MSGGRDGQEPRVLLCDADGTLFASEEPAYEASADVVNRLLASFGAAPRTAEELQRASGGKNFRGAAVELAAAHGREVPAAELERWVAEEKDVVTAHLRTALVPDPAVRASLEHLAGSWELAAVTSSARSRLDACLEVTGLADLFPPERRFSAEDSLAVPASKPDPAVYALAGQRLGVDGSVAVALEDSVNGVLSARGAGFGVVGTTVFVPPDQAERRAEELREAGAGAVVTTWSDLPGALDAVLTGRVSP